LVEHLLAVLGRAVAKSFNDESATSGATTIVEYFALWLNNHCCDHWAKQVNVTTFIFPETMEFISTNKWSAFSAGSGSVCGGTAKWVCWVFVHAKPPIFFGVKVKVSYINSIN
jgi:hypothetical protein